MLNDLLGDIQNPELACQEYFLDSDIGLTSICLGTAVCLLPLIALLDYSYYGFGEKFYATCAYYGVFAALSTAIFFLIWRKRDVKTYERSVFVWSMFSSISALLIDFLQPERIVENVMISEILLIAIYSLITNRFSFRMISAIMITIACVIALFATQNKASLQEKYLFILILMIINVAGLIIVSRNNRFKRIEYASHLREREARQLLEALAASDPLTGILNRRSFLEHTRLALDRFKRYSISFCLAIFDLDDLKGINDRYGHLAGDQAIQQFTGLVNSQKRSTDVFGRLGGDEFGFILLEAAQTEALKVISRIQERLRDLTISSSAGDFHLSFTAGVTEVGPADNSPDDLLGRADEALYVAKGEKRGGSRIK
jgi:diguanylate cyclase (GGDEF)-like protein